MEKIQDIINIALKAGEAIMEIYNSDNINVEIKSDNSPLTQADKISHELIKRELLSLYPGIPILSEEGMRIPFSERKKWNLFWLIDPLDGTKEFIKRNGEFTVNIALIENNKPVLGVVYAPAYSVMSKDSEVFRGTLYYGAEGIGSFKINADSKKTKLPCFDNFGINKAVRSRSHASPEEEKIFNKYNVTEKISVGSSLKFCMVAEKRAQVYYRHGPTNEWDVAAGYAIAKYAGAKLEGLEFNKPNLLNSSFLVTNVFT